MFASLTAEDVMDKLIELGRPGRFHGAGFYEYDAPGGKRVSLWGRPVRALPNSWRAAAFRRRQRAFLFIMSLETARCYEENVLRSVAEANVGSILGIGSPAHHGGAIQFMNGYEAQGGQIGLESFVSRADELSARYGTRFDAPDSVRSAVATGHLALDHRPVRD